MTTPATQFDIPDHVLRLAMSLKTFPTLMRSYEGPDGRVISKKNQTGQLSELSKDMRCGEFVCIAGTKTETSAKRLAARLWQISANQSKPLRTAWFSFYYHGTPIIDDRPYLRERRINAVFLTNILPDSSIQRIEKLKDALDMAAQMNLTRILLIGGAEPYKFCVERLRLAPAYAFYLESTR